MHWMGIEKRDGRFGGVWRLALACVAMFAFVGCASEEDDGDGGSGASGSSGSSGSSGGGVTPQAGCKPILLCAQLCQGDAACVEGCKQGALPDGVQLFDALSTCGGQFGCADLQCSYTNCPGEFEACQNHIGVGGFACFSEGFYEECDHSGNCVTNKSAVGAAWGATEAEAANNANADCTLFMIDLIGIAHITGTAQVTQECAVYECGVHQ